MYDLRFTIVKGSGWSQDTTTSIIIIRRQQNRTSYIVHRTSQNQASAHRTSYIVHRTFL